MPQTKEQGKEGCGMDAHGGDKGQKEKECGKADHKACDHDHHDKQGTQIPSQMKK